MKIFSLESKAELVAWSIGLGLVMNSIFAFFIPVGKSCWFLFEPNQFCVDWPIAINRDKFNKGWFPLMVLDYIFWVLVFFIILFIIRHFRKKNYQITLKQN